MNTNNSSLRTNCDMAYCMTVLIKSMILTFFFTCVAGPDLSLLHAVGVSSDTLL